MDEGTAARGGSAIDKAFDVLESLAEFERVTDIAAATGLPKSTVHRVLQALIERGFARSDGTGAYQPGPRILTLAGKVTQRLDPARQAEPALRRLRDATGHTVHFALRTGDEAVYVAKVTGLRPYQMSSRVGMSIPLHSTAIGKAVLALSQEDVREFARRVGLPRRTPQTLTTVSGLRTELGVTRARGFAIDAEENEAGIVCVGAAVRDHAGHVVGGVSVSTLRHDLADPEQLGPAVIAAAAEISRALGGQ